jgi:hypothetical protein
MQKKIYYSLKLQSLTMEDWEQRLLDKEDRRAKMDYSTGV